MIYAKKIEIIFDEKDEHILDGQSKICNWLYNQLLQTTIEDYKNGNDKKLLSGRNLRNYATKMKTNNKFLYSVHSSPLKNTAIRVKESYEKFFKRNCSYPNFRSFKRNWFSLFYDEPNKGFKLLDSRNLRISLGKNEFNKQIYVKGYLRERFNLKETEKVKNFRLCKQQGDKFYAVFTIERENNLRNEIKSWIAIDQNHKNLFVAIDNKGNTFEFEKLYQTKYFDKLIDEVKSKRDLCNRKNKLKYSEHGSKYYLPSKRYLRLNKTLDKLYHKKREQIKLIMYSIANYIAKNYDKAVIGDYTPTVEVAIDKNMHRGMLNQSLVGMFRKILNWTMEKSNKTCVVVSEKDTTKTCCVCGNIEKKDPSIRKFTCVSCEETILRDVNSAINIARKDNLEPVNKNLNKILKKGYFRFDRYTLEGI
ncbi:RNA-guided endonuclease InsQ/TnpB family protein [Clostridium sp.]|uniref:RNA-guided endonuclease InsQ/TnpB family protein n=1 Tax=Clostridium sp. TaxID=1506 RepID=UPI003F359E5F